MNTIQSVVPTELWNEAIATTMKDKVEKTSLRSKKSFDLQILYPSEPSQQLTCGDLESVQIGVELANLRDRMTWEGGREEEPLQHQAVHVLQVFFGVETFAESAAAPGGATMGRWDQTEQLSEPQERKLKFDDLRK
ncbi:hypothetical protein RRG08_016391 [Elysia crispata]|uniref:Uncharacterized protein n=1 Tax=Elysia crispata TaxID=231223 RepID=A0AAE0Y8P2_9GAST|nr:hypothetical protein RRG08_016391 [Elysia crispata]